MSSDPLVSIVVPTVGRPEALTRCLNSIAATVTCSHEVICVTVDDDEATADALRGHPVRTLVQSGRQGFVRAANAGFREARGEWLFQLNDDCRLLPHSVANAIRFLEVGRHHCRGHSAVVGHIV